MKSFQKQELTIPDLNTLSELLGFPVYQVREVSESINKFYVPGKKLVKRDGTTRETIKAIEPLAYIQSVIRERILYSVSFPPFLQGSIKDLYNPRDYINDARIHTGSKFIRPIDIKRFFPSIHAEYIYEVWHDFFGFSPEVSEVLTKLTTYKDSLPTGASTSPGLSNLIFFDLEPHLVESLNRLGFTYSRYVDDITISSKKYIDPKELGNAFELINCMLREKNLKINRRKSRDFEKNHRKKIVRVHNLNVKRPEPTIGIDYRSNFRSDLHKLETELNTTSMPDVLRNNYNKLEGEFAHIKRLHPQMRRKYGKRMGDLRKAIIFRQN